MNKEEVFKFLDSKGIEYVRLDHEPVFSMDDLVGMDLPVTNADAKNVFVYDKKNDKHYLITVHGDKKANLKKFKKDHGIKSLNFADDEQLAEVLEVDQGSVSPLSILNDKDHKVEFYLDKYFDKEDQLIACHPNENTATIWLKVTDLMDLIRENGYEASFFSNVGLEF